MSASLYPGVTMAVLRPHIHGWEWRVDYDNEGRIGGIVEDRETAIHLILEWTDQERDV